MSQRRLNKRILIFCEGVTEQLYAKSLRSDLPRNIQRSISVEIAVGGQHDPRNLVKEVIVKKRRLIRKITLMMPSGFFLIMIIGHN